MDGKGDLLKEEVLRLYAEGQSVNDIIEHVDMSYDSVLRLLKKRGVYRSKPVARFDETKERILELLDEKKGAMEVAKETQMPLTAVKGVLKNMKHGKREYTYAGRVFETYEEWRDYKLSLGVEIRKLWDEGISKNDIAAKFGITLLSVARFLN